MIGEYLLVSTTRQFAEPADRPWSQHFAAVGKPRKTHLLHRLNLLSQDALSTKLSTYVTEREMLYLTTHSTHFIYGYMASDIWLRTIQIVRNETCCRHIGYSYRLTAREREIAQWVSTYVCNEVKEGKYLATLDTSYI